VQDDEARTMMRDGDDGCDGCDGGKVQESLKACGVFAGKVKV